MSKAVKFRANASEVNKSPNQIRYIWIIEGKDGGVSTSTTYQTLERLKDIEISKLNLVDLRVGSLYIWGEPTKEFYARLMEVWRDNYFNYDWDISTI